MRWIGGRGWLPAGHKEAREGVASSFVSLAQRHSERSGKNKALIRMHVGLTIT